MSFLSDVSQYFYTPNITLPLQRHATVTACHLPCQQPLKILITTIKGKNNPVLDCAHNTRNFGAHFKNAVTLPA
jgi:hypothetical protein